MNWKINLGWYNLPVCYQGIISQSEPVWNMYHFRIISYFISVLTKEQIKLLSWYYNIRTVSGIFKEAHKPEYNGISMIYPDSHINNIILWKLIHLFLSIWMEQINNYYRIDLKNQILNIKNKTQLFKESVDRRTLI